ncbi:MAG TPA: hypothetical protein PLY91_09765 [Methanoregulaceae archaeon]|nr:hypothetical protein [Methanoregulaceae archaeon]
MRSQEILRKAGSQVRSWLIEILASKFHLILLASVLLGIVATILLKRPDYTIRALIFIIPAGFVSFQIFQVYRGRIRIQNRISLRLPETRITVIVFLLLFGLSVISLWFAPYRPWYYFVLIVALYCIVFLQILGNNPDPSLILTEISCIMGNLIFGLQLKYPLFFGYTDIIPHLYLSKITYLSSHTIPVDLDNTYANFPLYHIFIAIGKSIMGVDFRLAFVLLTSIAFIIVIWVVYLLANEILSNVQLSLLVCLSFACTPAVITYSTYVVTRVMAFIGFVYLLYLAQKRIRSSMNARFSCLLVLISIFIILVHQVSILQIIPLLILLFILELLVNDLVSIRPDIIALVTVTFSAYWVFVSTVMSEIVLSKTESISAAEIAQVRSQVQAGNEYSFLWNNIDTTVTILLVMLGIGFLLWAYRSKYPSMIGLFALLMIPLRFPSPLTASSLATITFRTDRFDLLLAPFFAIALGMGFLTLYYTVQENTKIPKFAPVCCLLIFSFLSMSALIDGTASDCVDFSSNTSRVYFTEPELTAFEYVTDHVIHGSTITTDLYSGRMFEQKMFSGTDSMHLPYFEKRDSLSSAQNYSFVDGFLILRQEEFLSNGLRFDSENKDYGDTIYPSDNNKEKFWELSNESNKIYDNRYVYILTK